MSKNVYSVDFFNITFRSLEDAKFNVKIGLSRRDALKYLYKTNEVIYHFIGDKLVSTTPIIVDETGNISFGKTRKLN